MKPLIKYQLDFDTFLRYIEQNTEKTNELSTIIVSTIKSVPGNCFTLLPENTKKEKIHEFSSGGFTTDIEKEVCNYIMNRMKGKYCSCIFDDVNVNKSDNFEDSFSLNFSLYFKNEVYYAIKRNNLSNDTFLKCMLASDGIWHSLCIITTFNLDDMISKELNQDVIEKICTNSLLVMFGAYDGEGYIFWEKNEQT